MDEDIIMNGDKVIVPPMADATVPLTPDVPVDVETPIGTGDPVVVAEDTTLISIGEFFGTIQESVTIAWRYHLKTNKHRIHVAMNEYYCGALNRVDSIIEQYQGASGNVIDNYVNTILPEGKTEVEYFEQLKSFVQDKKTTCGFTDEVISTIEDYQGLIDSTLYKLTSFTEHAVKSFEEFCFEDYEVIGVEGGVDGVFDTVTKTTKDNVAPNGASCGGTKPKKKCDDCKCDDDSTSKEEKEEEEEE